MRNELQRHKRSDKVKWVLTGIMFFLAFIMIAGLILQVFGTGKAKPSEWFKKQDSEQTEQLPAEGGENATAHTRVKAMAASLSAENDISSQSDSSVVPKCEHLPQSVVGKLWKMDLELYGSTKFIRLGLYDRSLGELITYASPYVYFGEYTGVDTGESHGSDISAYYTTLIFCFHGFSEWTSKQGYSVNNFSVKWDSNNFSDFKGNRRNSILSESYNEESDTLTVRLDLVVTEDEGSMFYFPISAPVPFYVDRVVSLPPDPVKEGHTFVGWYYDEEYTQPYNGESISSDTQLYAKFEINQFMVTFNSDGGSAVESQTVNWNTAATLSTPTRRGYNFKGWFLSDGTEYTNQPVTDDTTLTAHWEIQTFTVTFYVDGEVYTTKTVEYGQGLAKVAEAANLRIFSVRMASGAPTFDENGAVIVTENCSVEAQEMSNTDKAINTMKENKWAIIGGVAGGVALIAVIAAVCGGKRKRKR